MPIRFTTHPDEETQAIVLFVSIPMDELVESKIMTEFYGHPTVVELLTYLLEKAQENQNGQERIMD